MKNIFTLFFLLPSLFLFSQKEKTQAYPTTLSHHHNGTVCGMGEPMPGFVIPAPAKSRNNNAAPVIFEVTYGANVPEIAKTSFERATAILGDLFTSSMLISVRLQIGEDLAANTLAGAFPGTYLRNFNAAPKANAWYPIALAEKIAREEFNSVRAPFDIEVTYNAAINWNYTSTSVQSNQFDFVTVILHELMHGMGFSALTNVNDDTNIGTLKFDGISTAYSQFLEDAAGQNLSEEIDDPSITMGTALRSNALYSVTPSLGLNGERARIFAPIVYSGGSSISHLDERTYNGTPNALMTPSVSRAAIVHNPGPVALNMLYDLGWEYTSIIHEEGVGTEDFTQSFPVTAQVFSDNGYDAGSMQLVFSRDTFKTETVVAMTPTGNTDEFTATLPAPGEQTNYQYYFSVKDNRDLTFVAPAEAPTPFFFEYFYAADDIQPEIVHEPETTLDDKSTQLIIEASVTDFFTGLDDVFIDYKINGATQDPAPMQPDLSDGFRPDLYVGVITLPSTGLSEGDVLEYRIVANDKSPARNTITSPAADFYNVNITKTLDAVSLYVNDFVVDDNDFNGQGYSISQPAGFNDQAIHSIHPYTNAGTNNTRNFSYNLRIPIVVRKTEALIEFEEIVLVEPGEPGTTFGDTEFWDYVIVEGRRTNSTIWQPFLNGYDSNADPSWRSTYNNSINQQNSTASGSPRLYRDRTINMLENGNFFEGDTVLVRFRLFSDPFAVGWGWAIDNLRIQDTQVAIEEFVEEQDFLVYPNPIGEQFLTVEAKFKQPVKDVNLQLSNIHGQLLYQQTHPTQNQRFAQTVDILNFPKGVYLLTMVLDSGDSISRRIVRQ